jgi:hypothetical protein
MGSFSSEPTPAQNVTRAAVIGLATGDPSKPNIVLLSSALGSTTTR